MAISKDKQVVKISVSETESSEDDDSEYEAENSDENEGKNSDRIEAVNSDKSEAENSDENEADNSDQNDADNSDENDADNSDENEPSSDDDNVLMKNEGWADSITKILGANKPKNKKTLVLSRAKKLADIVKKENIEKPSFEVIGEDAVKSEKQEVKKKLVTVEEPPAKKKKKEKSLIRVKPNILEKDRERLLSKIATKGVVQLFNAVRNQQKTFDKELSKDIPEAKKEKVLKTFDKRAFLDTLMGQTKSILVDQASKTAKDEVKAEDKPRWSALRDDFMMGAKMKDWDKESVDE